MKTDVIRLGGQQAISLESLPAWESLPEICFDPTEVYAIDWGRLLRRLKTDPQERAYLRKKYGEAIPRAALPKELQWTRREVDRVRMRLFRKFRELRQKAKPSDFLVQQGGDSRHLVFHRRLSDGRRIWDLACLGQQFLRLMLAEWPCRTKRSDRKMFQKHKFGR